MSNYSDDVLSMPPYQPPLLAYWRLGESAGATIFADSSSGGNNLTKSGTVITGSAPLVTGAADTSALFDGSTGYAQTSGSIAALNFDKTNSFLVEAVIKPASTTGEQIVVGNIDAGSPFKGWEVSITGGALQFILSHDFSGSNVCQVLSTTILGAGAVYHLVWQYDGSGTAAGVSFYVNGDYAGRNILHDTLSLSTTTTQKVTIGSRSSSVPSSCFNGSIQELAIYGGRFYFQHGLSQGGIPRHYGLMLGRAPLGNTARDVTGGVKPNVILNANMVYDCDDSGQCNWAAVMHKNNEINLLCNVTGEPNQYACTASDAILNGYFGLGIPIGPSQRTDYTPNPTTSFNSSIQVRFSPSDAGRTNTAKYPKDDVGVARAALNSCPDGTVILISNSPLMSFNDLINSVSNYNGDGILKTGFQLFTKKVARVYYLGGNWPNSGGTFIDFNFSASGTTPTKIACQAAHDFFTTCASLGIEIVIVGPEIIYGPDQSQSNIVVGPPNAHPPASGNPLVNPVKYAYDLFGFSTGRQSFATILILAAVRGISPFFEVAGLRGSVTIDVNTGANTFVGGTNNNVSYVRPIWTNAQFAAVANEVYRDSPGGLTKYFPSGSGKGGPILVNGKRR